MRHFINLIENDIPDTSQMSGLRDKITQVAASLEEIYPDLCRWDKSWVEEVSDDFVKNIKRHIQKQNRTEYNIKLTAGEIFARWWRSVQKVDVPAAVRNEWKAYRKSHPNVEMSDEADFLVAEGKLADVAKYNSLDDIHSMLPVVNAMQDFIDTTKDLKVPGIRGYFAQETRDYIAKAVPLIMFYANINL